MNDTKFYFYLAQSKYTAPPLMHQSSYRGDPSVGEVRVENMPVAPRAAATAP
jgi:hypothetical protein